MATSKKTTKKDMGECGHCCSHGRKMKCDGETVYFIGLVGALVYYIQNATSFWLGVLGVLKALVWPAMLVYKLLGL